MCTYIKNCSFLVIFLSFYYRATLCVSVVFAVAWCPSVRPSVCLCVTLVHFIHTTEDIVKLLCRPSSPISLVF